MLKMAFMLLNIMHLHAGAASAAAPLIAPPALYAQY